MPDEPVLLVTGFEPFGGHTVNPSAELAKAVAGRSVGPYRVEGVVLPVHHRETPARARALLAELAPSAVLHLGLAEGRARVAVERVALNVMDYRIPDNAGVRACDEACVPGGPTAYSATLPVGAMVAALVAAGIPAYLSNTAGTFLCNQTLYATLHEIERLGLGTRAGFVHVPLLPEMVAAAAAELASMDLALSRRAVDIVLDTIARPAPA